MKRLSWMVLVFLLVGSSLPVSAQTGNGYSGHHWTISSLEFATSAPPILMTVVDSNGRRTGGDPSMPVGIHGQQGAHSNSGFAEIPLSAVDQTNIANDETDEDQPTTLWEVFILDGGRQTYTVNLFGIVTGEAQIHVSGENSSRPIHLARNRFHVLVAQGQTRQVNVTFDPSSLGLTVQRIIQPQDLGTDVKTACQLNLISPGGTRQDLQTKANAISRDAKSHNTQEEIQAIQVFLSALQAAGKNHIQDPAFTILQEDATALLKTVRK